MNRRILVSTGRGRAVIAVAVAIALLTSACNGGMRPTLITETPPTPEPPLQLELRPAPAGTPPLPPTAPDFAVEASVDDALLAWARDRSIPYIDACALVTPATGELCDVPTERDTIRLLGPNADEIWYIVTVSETNSITFGQGYRVSEIEVVGG